MQRYVFRRYLTIRSSARQYVDRLKDRPTSHLTAFAILHEITAILPFPLIYSPLKWTQLAQYLPIPHEYIQEGNRKINRVQRYYGFEPMDQSSLVFVHWSMKSAIVKLLLPLRIGLSLMLTPCLASILTRSLSSFFFNV